jgi:hypothetical protein
MRGFIGLRVIFNVLLLLLGLIGDRCCKENAKLRILRNESLDLTHFTGWLHGSSAAWATFKIKKFPVGWLGGIMILSGMMWTTADLAVSGLVVTINVPGRCTFNTSGLYEVVYNQPYNNYITPYSYGSLFNLIIGAQATSQTNGGIEGVYQKVNSDTTFRADTQDIVGKWNCSDVGDDQNYPAGKNITDVFNDLWSQNLLYGNFFYCADHYPDNTYNHLTAWSAPRSDEEGTDTWDVRASIDMQAHHLDNIVMKTFLCSMNATGVDWVLGRTNPSTLGAWCEQLKGLIYENTLDVPPVSNPGAVIESTLDAIIMWAGASQSGPNITTSPITDPTQGCLIPRALVPWPVLLLLIIVLLGTFAISAYLLFLLWSIRHLSSWRSLSAGDVPNGLLSWMVQAVLETGVTRTTKTQELKEWSLAPRDEEGIMRVARPPRRDTLWVKGAENSHPTGWDTGLRAMNVA